MWGLFQVINVVVLLNVCVALMNNTMIIINEEQCSKILTLMHIVFKIFGENTVQCICENLHQMGFLV